MSNRSSMKQCLFLWNLDDIIHSLIHTHTCDDDDGFEEWVILLGDRRAGYIHITPLIHSLILPGDGGKFLLDFFIETFRPLSSCSCQNRIDSALSR